MPNRTNSNVLAGRVFKKKTFGETITCFRGNSSPAYSTQTHGKKIKVGGRFFGRGGSDVTDRAAPEGSCRYQMKQVYICLSESVEVCLSGSKMP